MKNSYLLFSCLICSSSLLFSQDLKMEAVDAQEKLTVSETPVKAWSQHNKAYGDTLFYEDFANSLPAGWTVANNTGNSNDWMWWNAAPGGQYSTNITALNSTTGANGFMALRSDFYNTPFPPGGPTPMDAWFTSPALPITPTGSVILTFQHAKRYCCNQSNVMVAEVSTDGTNWTDFDAKNGRAPNTATPNPEVLNIDVSSVLANADTAYIRFRSTGNSHYYWMVDDVALLEGPENAMELEDYFIKFNHDTLAITPIYALIPQSQLSPVRYEMYTRNGGSNAQTTVQVTADVYNDSSITGGPGTGYVFSASALVDNIVPSLRRDTTPITSSQMLALTDGYFRNELSVSSDSINQLPIGERTATYNFAVNDTSYALDYGSFLGSTGPGNYVGGGNDGDVAAALFIVEQAAVATSVSVYIANRSENDGVSLQPRIYPFHEDSATLNTAVRPVIGSSPLSMTIDTNDFNTWVTLPLFPPVSLQPGAYYAGAEQTGGATNSDEMWFGRDQFAERQAPAFSNLYFLNDASPRWITTPRMAGIRLNFGNETVGIEEEAKNDVSFAIAPNPNEGQFKLMINSMKEVNYTLNVRNMLGQIVHREQISVNGQLTKQMDLNSYDKGVYFVTLENDNEKLLKKVVLK